MRRFLMSTVGALVAVGAMAGAACSADLAEEPNPLLSITPRTVNAPLPDGSAAWFAGVTDTDCAGVQIQGIGELEEELDVQPDGTTFCLARGTYRLTSPLTPDDGHKLIGGRGVVLTGAKAISGWTRSGAVWMASTGGAGPTKTDWSEALLHPQARYQEDLFLTGVPRLRKVGVLDGGVIRGEPASTVSQGEYFIDYDQDRIILGSDPEGRRAELSVTPAAIDSGANAVTVKSLKIQRFAGPGIESAGGEGWHIVDNEFRDNHTRALKVYGGARVVRNYIHHNGQYGVAGTGDGNLFSGNEIAFNNAAKFARSSTSFWDAGGSKFVRNTRLVLRDNYVHDNFGDGLWIDIDNAGVTIAGNRIEDNYRMGINYEISFSALIQNNSVTDNGDVGIWVNSSRGVRVTENLVKKNGDAIIIADQDRDGYAVRNIKVDNNEVVRSGITGTDDTRVPSFVANVYRVSDVNNKLWMWNDVEVDAAGWKGVGQDLTGRFISF